MQIVAVLVGLFCILIVLLDAFETIILPRTVKRVVRLTNVVFAGAQQTLGLIGRMRKGSRRQTLLSAFAPTLLIVLIVLWAVLLVFGFGVLHWGIDTHFKDIAGPPHFDDILYFSGVTFLTLGYGDVAPIGSAGRALSVIEAGVGFGFLALIISYIPVIYSAFSRREVTMLLLDAKAGSDPTAAEMLRRHSEGEVVELLGPLLKDWELFSAQLLESYLSYPILAYYRSQHDDQSWLTSLTAVMDTCALIELAYEFEPAWSRSLRFQAKATFAMARHLVVDLAYILNAEPHTPSESRLTPQAWQTIVADLEGLGLPIPGDGEAMERLAEIRRTYEPFVEGLGRMLVIDLPKWVPDHRLLDNWQTSAWDGQHF